MSEAQASTRREAGARRRPEPGAHLIEVTAEHRHLRLTGRLRDVGAEFTQLALVAYGRHRDTDLALPAVRDGDRFEVTVPLDQLVAIARPHDDTFDLHLRIGTGHKVPLLVRLRGAEDAPPGDPQREFPVHQVPEVWKQTDFQVYVTSYGNVSLRIRDTPREPLAVAAQRRPAPPAVRWLVDQWLHRVERRNLAARARGRSPLPAGRPPVHFVIRSVYGMGGTVRTVLNTANDLAERGYDVTILSVLRPREEPFFRVHPRVRVVPLFDERTRTRRIVTEDEDGTGAFAAGVRRRLSDRLDRWESVLTHPEENTFPRLSLLTDVLLVHALQRLAPGVAVLTRPVLNVVGGRYAPPTLRTVGQEHMNFAHHSDARRAWMLPQYRKLDVLAVLTQGDADDYARALAGSDVEIRKIPNGLTRLPDRVSDQSSRVVVALGRLTRQKGFDLLVPAFARVLEGHPDWELRIFGDGAERENLQDQIEQLGVGGSVRLMGRTRDVYEELARGSLFAMSSRFEGFGMVIIEAMASGLPVVSFDCPRGPGDIITPGRDGLLVPPRDVDALAEGLTTLISDPALRRSMAVAARETAERYSMARIGVEWQQVVDGFVVQAAAAPGTPAEPLDGG